jgi:predicted  nucleic acid-binding Zn-ribbon protein
VNFRSLLPVQALDQRLAQLAHREAQLPERAAAAAATRALEAAHADVLRREKRQGDVTGEIDRLEKRGKELDAKKAKYESQLKSVVVMREVEALQHEIATIDAEHSSLDDSELVLLDENESLDSTLAAARDALPGLEASADRAAAALADALGAVQREIAAAGDERATCAASVDAESLALYEQVRARKTGAAVAEIVKGTCGGCRTALSPKEQAELKKVADTTDARCPYCSCLLAV